MTTTPTTQHWLKFWPLILGALSVTAAAATSQEQLGNHDKRIAALEQNRDVMVVEIAKIEAHLDDQTKDLDTIKTAVTQGPK